MAYMSQERKALLKTEIDKVMPKNWKYTLAVRHHSTLVLTVKSASVDLIGENIPTQRRPDRPEYIDINLYNLQGEYGGKLLKTFQVIKDACNVGNHDRSDVQSDYFDVGWYVDVNIGAFERPFEYRPAKRRAKRKTGLSYEELKAKVAALEMKLNLGVTA